jgi:hypothetical protein
VRPAAAVIGLLCALAVLVWSPRSARPVGHYPRLATPATDVLRPARGTLWWVDRNCRVEVVRLPSGRRVGAGGLCHLWPAPSGRLALAGQADSQASGRPGNLELLGGDLHSLGPFAVRSDAVQPGVSWASNSLEAAACIRRGQQRAVVAMRFSANIGISVHDQPSGRPITGRCQPAFTADGRLVTSDGRNVYADVERLPIGRMLPRLVGVGQLDVQVTAVAAAPGGLVLAVHRRVPAGVEGPNTLVSIHSDGSVIRFDRAADGLIAAIGVSPDGFWLSVQYANSGATRLVSLAGARRPAAIPTVTRGLAWSPDGHFVAAALPNELRIVDLRTGRSTSITDIDPISVSWTR